VADQHGLEPGWSSCINGRQMAHQLTSLPGLDLLGASAAQGSRAECSAFEPLDLGQEVLAPAAPPPRGCAGGGGDAGTDWEELASAESGTSSSSSSDSQSTTESESKGGERTIREAGAGEVESGGGGEGEAGWGGSCTK
jgi:hypothetical protein